MVHSLLLVLKLGLQLFDFGLRLLQLLLETLDFYDSVYLRVLVIIKSLLQALDHRLKFFDPVFGLSQFWGLLQLVVYLLSLVHLLGLDRFLLAAHKREEQTLELLNQFRKVELK